MMGKCCFNQYISFDGPHTGMSIRGSYTPLSHVDIGWAANGLDLMIL